MASIAAAGLRSPGARGVDRVSDIAIEATLNSRQVTVPLRMVGDFPLIMESGSPSSHCSSPVSLQFGKVLRPVNSKESLGDEKSLKSIDERSIKSFDERSIRSIGSIDEERELQQPPKGRRPPVRRSSSRKSHHEFIDFGPPKPPPLPPKNKRIVENDDDEYLSMVSSTTSVESECRIYNLTKQIKMLEESNILLQETNKKLRRENIALNHQLQELMESNSKGSKMMKNRKNSLDIIAKYDCTEVQSLLCKMDLPQYVSAFAKEKVNGKIFLELDEIVLEIELGPFYRILAIIIARKIR
uniref:SAM domain-containing protein n=1 Tax=Amphimedon queenslandica TaxID=400682 RepID=A0A1X7VUI7_AMPQE